MHPVVDVVAQYAVLAVALVAARVWWRTPRQDRLGLAVEGVLAVVLVAVLVRVAGALHTDP